MVLAVLVGVMTIAAGLTWAERRLLAAFQLRYGPNRVGSAGLLQVVADTIKLLSKEDWVPPFADKPVFIGAPAILVVATLLSFAVIAYAPGIYVVDLNVGLLFFLAMSAMSVYSVVLAGWASNNKYALLGSIRAVGQMLSYESIHGPLTAGRGDAHRLFQPARDCRGAKTGLVLYPADHWAGGLLYRRAGRSAPHSLRPAGGGERISGGLSYRIFRHEVRHVFPGRICRHHTQLRLDNRPVFWRLDGPMAAPIVWFLLKTFVLIGIFILIRAALPRLRYDQLMEFGWKKNAAIGAVESGSDWRIILWTGR